MAFRSSWVAQTFKVGLVTLNPMVRKRKKTSLQVAPPGGSVSNWSGMGGSVTLPNWKIIRLPIPRWRVLYRLISTTCSRPRAEVGGFYFFPPPPFPLSLFVSSLLSSFEAWSLLSLFFPFCVPLAPALDWACHFALESR